MDQIYAFERRGRYYTSAEKDALMNGSLKEAIAVCSGRHSLYAIEQAYRRCRNRMYAVNGVPMTLDRLCLRLGIRYKNEFVPAAAKGKRVRRKQDEIIAYLASLPHADDYFEKTWLDTPELWAFVDPDSISDVSGTGCENLKIELQQRMDKWCDKWIPLSSISLPAKNMIPKEYYLFPFEEELKSGNATKGRKKYLLDHTYLAYSQVRPRDAGIVSEHIKTKVIELSGHRTTGYISFKYGIPIADVIRILNENRDQGRQNQ
ncbi:MAG: hypothetical protein IJI41_03860 [Anaerolineaceae bacterium]|nr:hypothetical protein [Anaerolineaceae bacterium]